MQQTRRNTISCQTACSPVRGRFPYRWDLNVYRGCSHGCRYCYALYSHDYISSPVYQGTGNTGRFYDTIYKKENIAEALERQLSSKTWKGEVINLGGVTDNYQSWEAENGLMTEVLRVLIKYRNPCIISTKSDLILRDYDLIDQLSRLAYVNIAATITCVDPQLAAELEPGAVSPQRRFAMLKEFAGTGAVTGVHVMPLIPYITTDSANLEALFAGASSCGAKYLLPGFLYLRGQTRESFFDWLFGFRPELVAPVHRLISDSEAYRQFKIPVWKEIRRLQEKYNISQDYMKYIRRVRNIGHHVCDNQSIERNERKETFEQLDFFDILV